MDKQSLRDAMVEAGASEQQFNSKAYKMAEQAVADDAVDGMATARGLLDSYMQRIGTAEGDLRQMLSSASRYSTDLRVIIGEARNVSEDVESRTKELGAAADEISVKDPLVRDAINAYTLVLMRTKQVFGDDNMTEGVMEKAIEAASYGMWRSIMGPKEAEKQPQKKSARTWL